MAIHRVKRLTATRSVAEDTEVIAFGDLHGRSDLLATLLDAAAATPRIASRREVVFLGDLVDRGPDPVGTTALAMGAGIRLGADALVLLPGNHELALKVALDPAMPEDRRRRAWEEHRDNGDATVRAAIAATGATDPREAVRSALGGYLAALGTGHHRSGDVLFVHAGVSPRMPLAAFLDVAPDVCYGRAAYDPELHWAGVRGSFLRNLVGPAEAHQGVFVVHGHSPRGREDDASDAWATAHSRLNLDAGSAVTGRARMAVLRGDVAEVFEAWDGVARPPRRGEGAEAC